MLFRGVLTSLIVIPAYVLAHCVPVRQHLDPSQAAFMGDNFVRISGESVNFAQSQLFAWEAYNKGSEVHLQANPTQVELLKKKFAERKEELEKKKQQSVLEKVSGGNPTCGVAMCVTKPSLSFPSRIMSVWR